VGLHCGICHSSYNVSNISYLNSPPFFFILPSSEIFLILCTTNNFSLYSGHVEYYAIVLWVLSVSRQVATSTDQASLTSVLFSVRSMHASFMGKPGRSKLFSSKPGHLLCPLALVLQLLGCAMDYLVILHWLGICVLQTLLCWVCFYKYTLHYCIPWKILLYYNDKNQFTWFQFHRLTIKSVCCPKYSKNVPAYSSSNNPWKWQVLERSNREIPSFDSL
jgi:hypothetical protein